ncbi:MAG: hypothetical protein VYE22_01070 [Myxococcota bacterium]|nr:hypothetical protein [Myxococcota bacterium]
MSVAPLGMVVPTEAAPAPAPVETAPPRRAAWTGAESPALGAARALAPWPVWALILALGVPGALHLGRLVHGPFALALVLGLMVLWTHRPARRSAARWLAAVLGSGLMAELLANAVTDMGRARGFGGLDDAGRAIGVMVGCVAIYEVAPILAATSGITREERRWIGLDLVAYPLFALAALACFAWAPYRDPGMLYAPPPESLPLAWKASPWMAALIALPFAAARCGPTRALRIPPPSARGATPWLLAAMAWAAAIGFGLAERDALDDALWAMRRGASPAGGALLLLPALSALSALGAAGWLLSRAAVVRHAPSGVARASADGGLTLERDGVEEPTHVAMDRGAQPAEGAAVTLLGARRDPPEIGPFRDGAPRLRAERAWPGPRQALSRSLTQRAGWWTAGAALGALGALVQLALV